MKKNYVQYGCGHSAPSDWINFDISPTLRIQKMPIVGRILRKRLNTIFPDNVLYGDIVKGLPIPPNSADAMFCSHTLEHLSLEDLRTALVNTFNSMKNGAIFRCVVPDLEYYARKYVKALDNQETNANYDFIGPNGEVLFGVVTRERGIKGALSTMYSNRHHMWMWDYLSLSKELTNAGFTNVRRCNFNDSEDEMFKLVEDFGRFNNCLAIEAKKNI